MSNIAHYARCLEDEGVTPAETLDALREYVVASKSVFAFEQASVFPLEGVKFGGDAPLSRLFICFCAQRGLNIYLRHLVSKDPNIFRSVLGLWTLAAVLDGIPHGAEEGFETRDTAVRDTEAKKTISTAILTIELLTSNGVNISHPSPHCLNSPARSDKLQWTVWEWYYLSFLDHRHRQVSRLQEVYARVTEVLLKAEPRPGRAQEQQLLQRYFGEARVKGFMELRRTMAQRQQPTRGSLRWPFDWTWSSSGSTT